MEMLDSFQPQDLNTLQEGLLASFADCAPAEDGPMLRSRMSRLLFALGAGFYSGKTHRARALDMSAMSRMSHDLKTPINAITGFSRVILKGIDGPITDFQQEDLTSIYEAGQRLLNMINDIFSVRKRDAARTLVYAPPFAAVELFADVLRTIQPIAAEREHVVQMRLARDLGSLGLDASMVRWILLSVLQYVVRRSTGSVISIEVEREAGEEIWLTTWISYRLTDAVLAYRETTADEAASQEAASGEGASEEGASEEAVSDMEDLAIITCRRFCEELGGALSRSEDQTGVTFTIRLPSVSQDAT
jgi:signal transduction histidine kinase